MDPIREQLEIMTRRHFFGRTGLGLGTAALSTLLAENCTRRDNAHRRLACQRNVNRRPARSAPFPPQGQAGDLSAYERRPVANGLV